jgi:primosomal protein N' (replication factor Y)
VSEPTQHQLFDEPEGAAPATLFADVVFDRPLDHAYTYAVPEHLADSVAVGKRVLAPFGKGDRQTVGFCVRLHHDQLDRAVKSLLRVVDEQVLLSADLLRLTRWMADYYLCGWGQVLQAVVPAGVKARAGTREVVQIEAVPQADCPQPSPRLSARQQTALDRLRQQTEPIEPRALARLAECGLAPIDALVTKGLARRVKQRRDLFAGLGESLPSDAVEPAEPPPLLNADQQRAWDVILPALREGGFRVFLLRGVTGSGKTEIYLRAIEEVVAQGKQAVVLVPEISLTPQTIQRFRGRFGEVAVLHSHLGEAERGGQWRRVAEGRVRVVVGARSAVFAPAPQLGLLVIDEEHETTFKQETTPRYHARDVAVMRGRLQGVPVLLGSATPSLESWHNAERGAYTLLHLPHRVLDRPMPRVALVDLRHEPPSHGRFHAISRSLERAMQTALRANGQVLLLLNRRGYSTYLHCPRCGHVLSCRQCDLALTYHRERNVALCHYCAGEQAPPRLCPQCGLAEIVYWGAGTEKLQAEVEEKFPHHVVRRMDSDTMKRPGSHERLLAAFRQGLVHVLLGTQMIAKGLDFPNVTLVGVVNADMALHLPDFRAAERTFQLLAQVAGRAGRGDQAGLVLVQTYNPDHPAIVHALQHDYLGFAAAELAQRREHRYPPYQRMARLIVRSRHQSRAANFVEHLAAMLRATLPRLRSIYPGDADIRILGPAEPPVFRLRGLYRYHFLLLSPSPATLHQLLRMVLPTVRLPAQVEYALDIDPSSML